jgi:hypothetical protein
MRIAAQSKSDPIELIGSGLGFELEHGLAGKPDPLFRIML